MNPMPKRMQSAVERTNRLKIWDQRTIGPVGSIFNLVSFQFIFCIELFSILDMFINGSIGIYTWNKTDFQSHFS